MEENDWRDRWERRRGEEVRVRERLRIGEAAWKRADEDGIKKDGKGQKRRRYDKRRDGVEEVR